MTKSADDCTVEVMTQKREVTNTVTATLEDIYRTLLHAQFYQPRGTEEGEEPNAVGITKTRDGSYLIHVENDGASFTYTLPPYNSTGFVQECIGTATGKLQTKRLHTFTPVDEATTEEKVEAEYSIDIPIVGPLAEARWAEMLEQELEGRVSAFEEYAAYRRSLEK